MSRSLTSNITLDVVLDAHPQNVQEFAEEWIKLADSIYPKAFLSMFDMRRVMQAISYLSYGLGKFPDLHLFGVEQSNKIQIHELVNLIQDIDSFESFLFATKEDLDEYTRIRTQVCYRNVHHLLNASLRNKLGIEEVIKRLRIELSDPFGDLSSESWRAVTYEGNRIGILEVWMVEYQVPLLSK